MSGHLDSFALDALVTDDPGSAASLAAWRAHVDGCASCRAAVEARHSELQGIAGDPRFSSWRPPVVPERPRARSWWPAWGVVGVMAAAALVLVVRPADDTGVRAKSEVVVRFVDAKGRPVTSAKVGQQVSFEGAPVGATVAVVLSKRDGAWSVVGPIPVSVDGRYATFAVTPGDVEAVVVFLRSSPTGVLPKKVDRPDSLEIAGEIARAEVRLGVVP